MRPAIFSSFCALLGDELLGRLLRLGLDLLDPLLALVEVLRAVLGVLLALLGGRRSSCRGTPPSGGSASRWSSSSARRRAASCSAASRALRTRSLASSSAFWAAASAFRTSASAASFAASAVFFASSSASAFATRRRAPRSCRTQMKKATNAEDREPASRIATMISIGSRVVSPSLDVRSRVTRVESARRGSWSVSPGGIGLEKKRPPPRPCGRCRLNPRKGRAEPPGQPISSPEGASQGGPLSETPRSNISVQGHIPIHAPRRVPIDSSPALAGMPRETASGSRRAFRRGGSPASRPAPDHPLRASNGTDGTRRRC